MDLAIHVDHNGFEMVQKCLEDVATMRVQRHGRHIGGLSAQDFMRNPEWPQDMHFEVVDVLPSRLAFGLRIADVLAQLNQALEPCRLKQKLQDYAEQFLRARLAAGPC